MGTLIMGGTGRGENSWGGLELRWVGGGAGGGGSWGLLFLLSFTHL